MESSPGRMEERGEEAPPLLTEEGRRNIAALVRDRTVARALADREMVTQALSALSSPAPQQVEQIASLSPALSPALVEQIKRLSASGKQEQLKALLRQHNLSIDSLRAVLGSALRPSRQGKMAVVVTAGRKMKERPVADSDLEKILHSARWSTEPIPSLSREVVAIFVPESKGNKLATRLCGFPVGGDVVLRAREGDLTIKDLQGEGEKK